MAARKIYVDINVFIYWLANHPKFGETAKKWIREIERAPKGSYVTSSLTLYETLVVIAGLTGRSLKDEIFVEEIIKAIMSLPGLKISPLTSEDLEEAVNLMREYELDYEDAIHLATSLRNNIKEVLSNDQDFDRTPLKRTFTLHSP